MDLFVNLFRSPKKMDYPPSSYLDDGLEEIMQDPIIVYLRFYWNDDTNMTSIELAEFMTSFVHVEFYDTYMPRYAKCLREVFDQAIYIDSQHMNPYNTHTYEEMYEYNFETNTLKIVFEPSKIPHGWTRDEIVWSFNEFGEMLAHTLWESAPGTNMVHGSGAVVDFEVL